MTMARTWRNSITHKPNSSFRDVFCKRCRKLFDTKAVDRPRALKWDFCSHECAKEYRKAYAIMMQKKAELRKKGLL